MRVETLAVHAGRRVDPATGAVTLPIHVSTTFERDPDGSFPRGHLYARNSNPTRQALETCLAELDGGAAAAAFASGTAAVTAVFQALRPGDHVIAPTAFGGMLSFQVRGGADEAMAVAARLRLFTRATSFGGTESLIEHRASIEGPGTRTPENLLRVSVGLEHVDDLIDDLAQALG